MKTIHRFPIRAFLMIVLLLPMGFAFTAESAADFRQKGINALKESQTNPAAIVPAARNFAKAAALYEREGKTDLAVEMNSYLYWCKKKMSIRDIEAFVKGEEESVATRLTAVENNPPKADDAQTWINRVDEFARNNPNEHYLIAVRYFEIAGRFMGTPASLAAQEKSLQEVQLAMSSQTVAPGKP